ncbi:MAG: alpha/beta fold hydrolase [Methylococcaceae bacterium]|nr:alpha/beta fold hydrolase [Methylococcaceae bacterium]
MISNDYYSQKNQGPFDFFVINNFKLEYGGEIKRCEIAYSTHGVLNEAKDNLILFPHMFSGTSKSLEAYVGEGKALDPNKYFIVFPNQIGNGISTSPHQTKESDLAMGNFPKVSISDDVRAQHQLITECFGVTEIALVLGWSMGGQQAFEWAVRYPGMVKRAAPIGATAKASAHNAIFIQAVMRCLQNDPAYNNGFYQNADDLEQGLRHLASLFAMVGVSKEFYQTEQWSKAQFSSLESFMTDFWEAWFKPMDPNALLSMLWKWQHADVSRNTGGDLKRALKQIKAIVHNMPFEMDMMFADKECKFDSELIPNCQHKPIPSLWGHFAMFGVFQEDFMFIDRQIRDLLEIEVD